MTNEEIRRVNVIAEVSNAPWRLTQPGVPDEDHHWNGDQFHQPGAIDLSDLSLSDLSHSYPFLDLSQRLGVGYGTVLAAAQRIDGGWLNPDDDYHLWALASECDLGERQTRIIANVCAAPWRWQFPPQGRGL